MPRPVDAIEARWAWTHPAQSPMRENARIEIADGRVASVGDAVGAPKGLVMPALSNAHDHGRGLKALAYGAPDDIVELWVPATYQHPAVDPYLVAAASFGRMALGGCASIVHCHLSRPPEALVEEARAVFRAARDVGIRLAFVAPLRDRHRMVYGDDEALLARVAPEDREAIAARFQRPIPSIEAQMEAAEAIAGMAENPMIQMQYGPIGVEWCSDALLEAVAEASARTGRRVHMHLLESRIQREWADHAYPQGILAHLDRFGLLTPRLTLAHGVWLREAECALLAERGVTVSLNTSSNLRLRSGIAPFESLARAGTRVALGMDALALDDDDDALRELRLAWRIHAVADDAPITVRDALLHAVLVAGPHAAGGEEGANGTIEPGRAADLMVLDAERMTRDLVDGLHTLEDAFFTRARAGYLKRLIVAGRTVVGEVGLTGVDLEAVEAALTEQAEAAAGPVREGAPLLERYQAALRAFYQGGGHRR